MRFIGITGGVGAGKSTVLDFISNNYNCEILLADDVAKSMYIKGNPCFEKIIALLGEDILDLEGNLDKKAMAAKIYADAKLLKQVNDIVHPAVKEEIFNRVNKCREEGDKDYFFLEAALLIETGYKEYLDELWFVYINSEERKKRLMAGRGYSEEKIRDILKSQLSDEEFIANSDFVIDNSFSYEYTAEQIRERMKRYEQN